MAIENLDENEQNKHDAFGDSYCDYDQVNNGKVRLGRTDSARN